MRKILLAFFVLFITASANPALAAEDVYQSPEEFISESFSQATPKKAALNLHGDLSEKVAKVMGRHYKLPQTIYWTAQGRTAWILEDIGKYKPITVGIVIGADGKIERLKVLIYRESHGWEVKHSFFTKQFKGADLRREKKLDKRVDGISGATLSVSALKRLSALALTLHKAVSS